METKKETGLQLVSKQLNENVLSVLTSTQINGFEKAYMVADAIRKISDLLTPEYMKPIMELQGKKLGFKCDKVYDEKQVKDCLIDAVLSGVQPTGNQFNIIAGNMYITKEGFGYLLKNVEGLNEYNITFDLPRIKEDKTSAAIMANIQWVLNGDMKEKKMDIPVRMNSAMGTDAVIGKATRKSRAWLFNTIMGTEFGDGDAADNDSKRTVDITHEEVKDKKEIAENAEANLFADQNQPQPKIK